MKNRILTPLVASLVAPLVAVLVGLGSNAAFATDQCSSPTPIAGSVVVPFDMSGSALDANGINSCGNSLVGPFSRDYWYCWTSDVDGMVTISTCGLTNLDTGVAIYPESISCGCPGDMLPVCCNDDGGGNCGKQSSVTCEVKCGRRYMIQVAARPSGIAPVGQVRIDTVGNPCAGNNPHEAIVCAPCCGGRPEIVDSSAVSFNSGAVAAGTYSPSSGSSPVVALFDLGNQGTAPIGLVQSWNNGRYSNSSWSLNKLGSVFGVVIDDVGDIVVTQTIVYNFDMLGALGGAGSVYRLNGATGAATELIRLPNTVDAANPAGAGLGQVDFSCRNSLYYVSNFEDGRIYAIDQSGAVKGTFDHASGVVTGALPAGGLAETGDAPGAVPPGERVWAVKAVDGRLVYSLWVEDGLIIDATRNNEIWSVKLDVNGLFVANTAQLELSMPSTGTVTYPVADIAFDSNCCMYTAERGMMGVSSTTPHVGRLLKFCATATGAWSPATETFSIGTAGSTNSVGGVDIEGLPNDRVWSIGDGLNIGYPNIYGLIGFPAAGGDRDNSILIDFDNDFNSQLKTQYGSIDITCVEPKACEFKTEDISCKPNSDATMGFLWTVQITNNSSIPANLLILPDSAFSPNNVITISPALAPNASTTLYIPISIGVPGSQFCFSATLAGSTGDACCTEEICVELPDCTCMETDVSTHDVAGINNFEFTLNLTNLTALPGPAFAGEWVSLAVAPGYAATINPTLVNIPTLPVFNSAIVGPITVNSALPAGSTIIVIVGLHSQLFHPCCFREITLTVPAANASSTPGDATGDGAVNGKDLGAVLSSWGLAGSTDFNADGTTNGQDLAILLANWS